MAVVGRDPAGLELFAPLEVTYMLELRSHVVARPAIPVSSVLSPSLPGPAELEELLMRRTRFRDRLTLNS